MKKFLLKVTSGPDYSFTFNQERRKVFYDEFHFHPQLELTLIIQGSGTRFVGDNIETFSEGDLVLIGPNLPHLWKSNPSNYQSKTRDAVSCTIHFSYDFLGETFFNKPELKKVKTLMSRSAVGLRLFGKLRHKIEMLMLEMKSKTPMDRLIGFLEILHHISESSLIRPLSSKRIAKAYEPYDNARLQAVHQFIIANFRDNITLKDVASKGNMSPTGFSRYFKQKMSKTYMQFLTEVRIGFACQLLKEKKLKISQVCYDSGYSNISNFNRQFKLIMRLTPQQYLASV
ncbi:AraC family transcriptional regulator [soil metagenome]